MSQFLVLVTILAASLKTFAGGNFKPLYPPLVPNPAKVERPVNTTLMEPGFYEKVSGTQVTVKWKPVEMANKYHLQVATDANFWNLIVDNKDMTETTFQVDGLESGKHYFWRVYTLKTDNDVGYIRGQPVKSMFKVQ